MKNKKGILAFISNLILQQEVYNKDLINNEGAVAYDIFLRDRIFLIFKGESRKIGSIYYKPSDEKYTLEIDKFDSTKEYKTPKIKNTMDILKISFEIAFKSASELLDLERKEIPVHDRRQVKVNLNISDCTNNAIEYYIKEMNK